MVHTRIDSLSEDISQSLSDKIKDFVAWTFATDESTDQKDTAQLAIFVKGVDIDLNETEEFLALQSMKDTTTGGDIFAEVCDAIERFGLDWSKLCGMASDGAPAMSGLGVGLVGRVKAELREKGLNDDITGISLHHPSRKPLRKNIEVHARNWTRLTGRELHPSARI